MSQSEIVSVWITVASEATADLLIAGLVREGFGVTTQTREAFTYGKGLGWPMLAIEVADDAPVDGETALEHTYDIIQSICAERSISHLSLVLVAEDGSSMWDGPNIISPNAEPEATQPPSKPSKEEDVPVADRFDRLLKGV